MGSMGKRRDRRTRSDAAGEGDADGWPVFQHNQWTWAGTLERHTAFVRGAGRIRARGGRRAISNADLVVPILTTAVALAILVVVVAVILRAVV
jgi:hypothetical protein